MNKTFIGLILCGVLFVASIFTNVIIFDLWSQDKKELENTREDLRAYENNSPVKVVETAELFVNILFVYDEKTYLKREKKISKFLTKEFNKKLFSEKKDIYYMTPKDANSKVKIMDTI